MCFFVTGVTHYWVFSLSQLFSMLLLDIILMTSRISRQSLSTQNSNFFLIGCKWVQTRTSLRRTVVLIVTSALITVPSEPSSDSKLLAPKYCLLFELLYLPFGQKRVAKILLPNIFILPKSQSLSRWGCFNSWVGVWEDKYHQGVATWKL